MARRAPCCCVGARAIEPLQLTQAMDSTTRLTTFVIFILIGSTIFTLVFRGLDGDVWVEHLFNQLPGGVIGFLIVVNLMVFTLAFFLDFFEIAFIVVPLVGPIAAKLGIDPIWFGVMLASTCRPPSCIRLSASPCST